MRIKSKVLFVRISGQKQTFPKIKKTVRYSLANSKHKDFENAGKSKKNEKLKISKSDEKPRLGI